MKKPVAILALALWLAGCTNPSPEQATLTVSAAASLTQAFTEIGQAFEASQPAVQVVFNFGASSTLRAQLLEGAPADVFASANPDQMQLAVDGGAIGPQAAAVFASNALIIVTPADNPAGLSGPVELATPGLKLVLAAPEVPAGAYAQQVLELMAADFGAAFLRGVQANVVSLEDSVRGVLGKVALGEADAGIVYASDAFAAPDLLVIPIAAEYNVLAEYPLAVTTSSPQPELANEFVAFVLSPEGQAILRKWGFGPPP